jgi:endonuclease/exonuclease/phosphatase family metal-dependent hydrolase
MLLGANLLFLLLGVMTLRTNGLDFPSNPAVYPIDPHINAVRDQLPLFGFILLCPVVLFDFTLLSVEVARRRPSPRALAGGFFLASLFFLIVVLAQAFTTVYDYIPVIGPFFRDRFWLVFLLAGFGLVLPLPWVRGELPHAANHSLRRAFLPGVLAVLLGSVVWAVISHPRPVLPQAGSPLRVMTYNIQQGYSEDGVRSYDQQLRLIRTARPDILGLQESDPARFAGGNADVVRAFANSLDMYAYYGPKTPTGTFGIALLSRYPIENPRTFFLYSQGEQTAAILAQISVEGQPYTVLVTHLGNGGPMIQQQQVLGRLAGRERVIAMGDFNFDLASEQYALTDAQLDSAWTLAGSPYTPGLNVDHLIDHVFVSPGMQVNSAEYLVAPVSDHPALVVEIQP